MVDLTGYYNRFNPVDKLKKILWAHKRPLQSSELNEVQDMVLDEIHTISNVLHKDGSLLEGGEMKLEGGFLQVNASLVYALGFTHRVPSAAIAIGATEDCVLGVNIVESIVTAIDEPLLRDQAVGTRAFGQRGADRLKMQGQWVKESSLTDLTKFFPQVTIVDGLISSQAVESPEFAGLDQRLAKYDYSANGSYVVSGFIATYIEDDDGAQQHTLSVSEGSAHVEGYIIDYEFAHRAFVDYALDDKSINNEPVSFVDDGWYTTRWGPIATVGEISAQIEVTRTLIHGSFSGALDLLPDLSIVSITQVKQGAVTYTAGADYTLSGDYISWAPSGAEPATGSSYTVKYVYEAVITPVISDNRTQVYLAGLLPGSTPTIDYTFYIPRVDKLVLKRDGALTVVKGVPDFLNPVAPTVSSGLTLATIRVLHGKAPLIKTDYLRAFQMSDIQNVFSELDTVKYNISQLVLRDAINNTDTTLVKRNIFTDPFTNNNQRDFGVTQNALTFNGVLEGQVISQDRLLSNNVPVHLPFTQVIVVEQGAWSKTRLCNEFAAIPAPPAIMSLEPSVYTWTTEIFQTTVQDIPTVIAAGNVKWQKHPGGNWSQYNQLNALALVNAGSRNGKVSVLTAGQVLGFGQTTTTTREVQPTDGEVYNIPQVSIQMGAERFQGGETVNVTFDSQSVGSAIANSGGHVNLTFSVPANVPSGAKAVIAVGQTTGIIARGTFLATPQVLLTTTTSTRFINQNPLRIQWVDPIAQTFTPETTYDISSVDLQFANTTALWVDVILCETINGYPNSDKALAHTRLYGASINTTGWTRANFDTPVLLEAGEEYSIIIMTADNDLLIRVAELGQWDMAGSRWITRQAFTNGVLFNSSNARAWTALQSEDLMFRLNRADYSSTTGWVVMGTESVVSMTDLMLVADLQLQSNTSIELRVTLIDRGNAVLAVNPNVPIIIQSYTGQVRVEYRLTSTNSLNTPTLRENATLGVGHIVYPGLYVTRRLAFDGDILKVQLVMFEPSGSSIGLYYESAPVSYTTTGQNYWAAVSTVLGTGIGTYRYSHTLLGANKPAVVQVAGLDGKQRLTSESHSLLPGEFMHGDLEIPGTNRLYVQVPQFVLSRDWSVSHIAGEYYYTNALSSAPGRVIIGGTELVQGTLGSLLAGQYAFGNNDTLATSRLYIRMPVAETINSQPNPGNAAYPANFVRYSFDPDQKGTGYIQVTTWVVMTRGEVTPVGDDVFEVKFVSASDPSVQNTRLRIELNTSTDTQRPVATNLRSYSV